jgi:hypothetical protein
VRPRLIGAQRHRAFQCAGGSIEFLEISQRRGQEAAGDGIRPGTFGRALVGLGGVFELPVLAVEMAQIQQWISPGGLELARPGKCSRRFMHPATIPQHKPEIALCLGEMGTERYRATICRDRVLRLAAIPQRVAQVVMRFGKILAQSDRLTERRDGLIDTVQISQRVSKVIIGFGKIGPLRDGLSKCGNRLLGSPPIAKRIAEIVICFGKLRLD